MEQQTFTDSAPGPRPRVTALESGPVLYGVVILVIMALVAAVAALGFLTLRWLRPASRPFVARDVRKIRRPGKVFLVPLGNFHPAELEELAGHYAARYGTPVEVGPGVRLPSEAYDGARRQLVAEYAIATLRTACPGASCEPPNVVIGVTADDMYIREKSWSYAYSYRFGSAAVVSTARMNAPSPVFTRGGDPDLRHTRLRKMVAKNIGVLYYRLPLSNDPRSLLYRDIGGPRELDHMGEEF